MITADASVWIGFLNGQRTPQTRALEAALDDDANEIVLLDLTLMEVLRGFRNERDWRYARSLFEPLPLFTAGGESTALAAAALYRDLRQRGVTVRSSIDLLVGAWCIRNDCALIHADRDFDGMREHHGLPTWSPEP
ncbi:MAG: PIN domain nuclease [Pseudomonadota bacterium]